MVVVKDLNINLIGRQGEYVFKQNNKKIYFYKLFTHTKG